MASQQYPDDDESQHTLFQTRRVYVFRKGFSAGDKSMKQLVRGRSLVCP